MSCPLALISTPPQSPVSKQAQFNLSMVTIPMPKSPITLRRTFTPASPCEAMPSVSLAKPKSAKPKLGKGCSLLDWIRLCRSKKSEFCCNDGTPKGVTKEELAKHDTKEDAWTAIRGKVYNISPYMKFHPGGVEDLLKAAGKDSTILFDEAHKWVNVESMLKFCFVGPLLPDSPATMRRNSMKIAKAGAKLRSNSLTAAGAVTLQNALRRRATQAAVACEENDGMRQDSPESPIKLFVPPMVKTAPLSKEKQEAEESSGSLIVPEPRARKNSDVTRPYPKFDWVQSERAIIIRVTQCPAVKSSDVIIDMNGQDFEAAIFINDWVYELNIELEHTVENSQVNVNGNRVEIVLKKHEKQEQWGSIGNFKPGHLNLHPKNTRDAKYHPTTVEAITTITHDSKVFTLRLPTGSHLSVPTGHHLTIRADIDGENVTRSYTPTCSSEELLRHSAPAQTEGRIINLMVKLYKDGKMSRFLSDLSIGDEVWVSDPEGTFDFTKFADSNLVLVAAGTGFTPMVKVLHDFFSAEMRAKDKDCTDSAAAACTQEHRDHKECQTRTAKLLFANKTEEDILWREELNQLTKSEPERFEVVHVLSDTKDTPWEGVKGRINSSLLKNYLPLDKDQRNKTLVCVCGPCQFTAAISNVLLDENYPEECIHCFT